MMHTFLVKFEKNLLTFTSKGIKTKPIWSQLHLLMIWILCLVAIERDRKYLYIVNLYILFLYWYISKVWYLPVLSHFLQRKAGHKKPIEQGLANAEWPKHQKLNNKDEIATWFVSPLISLHFQWCETWPQETASWLVWEPMILGFWR